MYIHLITKEEDTHGSNGFRRCARLRRTDRAITQFYDAIQAKSDVSITQFTLLATLASAGPMAINRFAELLLMDRTTLTRNLRLLARQAWVRIEEGEDRRTRIVAGEEALMRALPLWKQAHAYMLHGLGEQQVDTLRADLAAVVALSQ